MSWYHVTDSATARVERRFRQFLMVTFFAMIAVANLTDWWWVILVIALWSPLAMRFWVLRDVPRTVVADGDLVRIDRRARDLAHAQQMGEPMLWFMLASATLMAALGVVVAVTDGIWWAWFGLVLFGWMGFVAARQIVLLRRARQ
jgi:hypothetical protein